MRLSRLLAGLSVAGPFYAGDATDPEISGLTHDSRRVQPGDLFVAWKGERFDGTRFAADAVAAGAVAVLGPEGSEGKRPSGVPASLPWVTAADPHRALAPLASRLHAHPDRELTLAAVTGTNGKSTVAVLLQGMLQAAGRSCGLIGTLGYHFAGHRLDKGRTTPEASDFFHLLRTMRDAGASAVSMEVSSHALALGRVEAAAFDLAVFTNLSRDHLDFHADMEDYFLAKRRLFGMLKEGGRAAVNLDDGYGQRLAEELPAGVVVGWGEAAGDVHLASSELDERGIRGRFVTPRGELAFESPLVGRFNLLNLLAAVAGAEALGLPHEAIARAIAEQPPVAGRMQPVGGGQSFPVYVDYSHTDAALTAALTALRELTDRRLIVVFGCGGERDRGKRPIMGRVAGELSDLAILTSDNPRGEDPMTIVADVEPGLKKAGADYRVEPDRRQAIRLAIELAAADEAGGSRGAAVLIAGKGDEPVQIVGGEELPFYDHEEAMRAITEHQASGSDVEEALGAA
ncbi:MAG TPA: UDP-N-acetylmuramoyl-L-alanyl-D-glutamate--2,6-diaminopimelate ligase [Thermoanaerobaculia bacterium]|nr:UDP-N-acetylmuramoyl-L-alanyl-D-glutamate--2,6-diaminopimelate ligase [Thermoanaerobaculia bacterium]